MFRSVYLWLVDLASEVRSIAKAVAHARAHPTDLQQE